MIDKARMHSSRIIARAVLCLCACLWPSFVRAETAQFVLPLDSIADACTTHYYTQLAVDLGHPLLHLESVTFHIVGSATAASCHCHRDWPNMDYEEVVPMYLSVALRSTGAFWYEYWEPAENGAFDDVRSLAAYSEIAPLTVDGTGEFSVEYGPYWFDHAYWCEQLGGLPSCAATGELAFNGALVIDVVYEVQVPNALANWGSLKALYR